MAAAMIAGAAAVAVADQPASDGDVLAAVLRDCAWNVDTRGFVPVPADVGFELTAKQRIAAARAIRDDQLKLYGEREAKIERRVHDAWIKAGAEMTVTQAVALPLSPAKVRGRKVDRLLVVEYDHARYGRVAQVIGIQPRTGRFYAILSAKPGVRLLATADIDGDGWTEVLIRRRDPTVHVRHDIWWGTPRLVDPDFPHLVPRGDAYSCAP